MKTLTIAAREMRAYFLSPIAYIALVVFLIFNGIVLTIILAAGMQYPTMQDSPLEMMFGGTVFFWLILPLISSAITMRLIAEERRSGTLEQLMTAPVREVEVVLGKFLAAVGFSCVLWLPTLLYVYLIGRYSSLDPGPVAGGYVGAILVGSVFIAAGLFTSALTRNQIVAVILSFLITVGFFFVLGIAENVVSDGGLKSVFGYVNLFKHMEHFAKGIIDTRHLVLYATLIALLLFGAVRALEVKKGT